jgi:hypothetical protein
MAVMAKKDPQRIAFQYTKDWADLARQLAKKDQKPTIWFLSQSSRPGQPAFAHSTSSSRLQRTHLPNLTGSGHLAP